jgi:DNA primase
MIPNEFIDTLLERTDIVALVGRELPLKKKGSNYSACCPFHKEKTPSFTVSAQKQFYHCFGCGASGSALTFLMKYHGQSFVDAVDTLAREVGLTVPRQFAMSHQDAQRLHDQRKDYAGIMERAANHYKQQLKASPEAVAYCQGRGLSGDIAAHYALGYATDAWDGLKATFGSDYSSPMLRELGLVMAQEESQRLYDRFRDRLMFPIRDERGMVIGFGGRVMRQDAKGAKYLNSPETPLFEKGQHLYGLFEAKTGIKAVNHLLVVEGYMDVIALAQQGIAYAVATMGTATTAMQLKKMMRYADHITFCFDGDEAGKKAAVRAMENSLPILQDGKQLDFLFLPNQHDPDSFIRSYGKVAFEDALRQESMSFSLFFCQAMSKFLAMDKEEGRMTFIQRSLPLLAQIKAPILQLMLKKRVAQLGQIDDDDLAYLAGEVPVKKISKPQRYQLPKSTTPRFSSKAQQLMAQVLADPSLAAGIDSLDAYALPDDLSALMALIEQAQRTPDWAAAKLLAYFKDGPHGAVLQAAWQKANGIERFHVAGDHAKQAFDEGWLALLHALEKHRFTVLAQKGLAQLTAAEKKEMHDLMKRMANMQQKG